MELSFNRKRNLEFTTEVTEAPQRARRLLFSPQRFTVVTEDFLNAEGGLMSPLADPPTWLYVYYEVRRCHDTQSGSLRGEAP